MFSWTKRYFTLNEKEQENYFLLCYLDFLLGLIFAMDLGHCTFY